MMPSNASWERRVLVFWGAVLAGSTLVWNAMAERILDHAILSQARELLSRDLEIAKAAVMEIKDSWDSFSAMDELADRLGAQLKVRVSLISVRGKVVGDSHVDRGDLEKLEDHSGRPEVREALTKGTGWAIRPSSTMGVDSLYVASLCGAEKGEVVVRLATRAPFLSEAKGALRWASAGIFILGISLCFVMVKILSRMTGKMEEELLRKNLQEICENWERFSLSDGRGELLWAKDLRDRIQKDAKGLRENMERLNALLDGMVEGVMLMDSKGRIELVNRALASLMRPRVDPLGKSPAEAYRLAPLQEAVEKCMGSGEPEVLELQVPSPSPKVVEVQLSPVPTGGVVGVFRDVTEKKRMEEIKRNLVANVSHELRTPLTAIRGAVEGLLDGALNDPSQAQKFALMIQRQVLRLEKMVKDLLDLSRLEGQGRPSDYVELRAGEVAWGAVESVKQMAEAKGLDLECSIVHPEAIVRGNPADLEQALVNLLDNAIRFTDRGKVTLRVDATEGEVHFSVKDTGIGIAEEHIPRIFERFYRVDKGRSREKGGSGLGLSIVKHIVENHGGRVEVESTPGQGSTFRIVLPKGARVPEKDQGTIGSNPLRKEALLVDEKIG